MAKFHLTLISSVAAFRRVRSFSSSLLFLYYCQRHFLESGRRSFSLHRDGTPSREQIKENRFCRDDGSISPLIKPSVRMSPFRLFSSGANIEEMAFARVVLVLKFGDDTQTIFF